MIRCCAVLMWPLKGERPSRMESPMKTIPRWRSCSFLAESCLHYVTTLRSAIVIAIPSVVCLSVSLMSSIHRVKLFRSFLHRVVAQPSGSVVKKTWRKRSPPYFLRGLLRTRGMKNRNFWPIFRFISQTIQQGKTHRNSYAIYPVTLRILFNVY